jgi:hypothetical protein
MQIHQTNNQTRTSLDGNSRSLEKQADNCSTHHHHNHLPDVPTKVAGAAEEAAEAGEAVEEAEEDYLRQQDQACFHHTDELLTRSF